MVIIICLSGHFLYFSFIFEWRFRKKSKYRRFRLYIFCRRDNNTAKEAFFMKKGKLLAVCVIGVLMAVGLVLAGCGDQGCSGDGACSARSIPTYSEGSNAATGTVYEKSGAGDNCSDSSCAANKIIGQTGPYPGDLGKSVSCDC
jgi:hypothetical protein